MLKTQTCPHECGESFTCDESCGREGRNCWCRTCFFKGVKRALRDGSESFNVQNIQDRFKCSLLTDKEKRKLVLLFITNKIRNKQEGDC